MLAQLLIHLRSKPEVDIVNFILPPSVFIPLWWNAFLLSQASRELINFGRVYFNYAGGEGAVDELAASSG